LLARLFRYGTVCYHGGFVNLATGATSVLRIDPQGWRRIQRVNKHNALLFRRQQAVPMAQPTNEELIARVGAFEKLLVEKKNRKLEFKV
jgi:hypothetical protein